MATFQPPPTYAEVILEDPSTKKPYFNPIWLRWFLDLTNFVTVNSVLNASGITNVPAGGIAATNVQAALNELDTEKAKVAGDAAQNFSVLALFANAPVRLKGYTVATLPAGTQGDTAFVTNALAPAFHVAAVGGGAVVTPVFYNGAAWIVI